RKRSTSHLPPKAVTATEAKNASASDREATLSKRKQKELLRQPKVFRLAEGADDIYVDAFGQPLDVESELVQQAMLRLVETGEEIPMLPVAAEHDNSTLSNDHFEAFAGKSRTSSVTEPEQDEQTPISVPGPGSLKMTTPKNNTSTTNSTSITSFFVPPLRAHGGSGVDKRTSTATAPYSSSTNPSCKEAAQLKAAMEESQREEERRRRQLQLEEDADLKLAMELSRAAERQEREDRILAEI
ncbi:unnamed protein product, partial [Amoebophrya sp. A25]